MVNDEQLPDLILICDEQGTYYAIPQDALASWRVPEELKDVVAKLADESEVTGYATSSLQIRPIYSSQLREEQKDLTQRITSAFSQGAALEVALRRNRGYMSDQRNG